MKSASFHLTVHEAYRADGRSLTVFLRALKEAGLITSGGRGRHAPHMQPVDAARITIALLATDKPARAVDRLERFGKLTFQSSESKGPFPVALGIEEGATFEEVLTNLFTSDLDTDDVFKNSPYVEVQENARSATIEFSNGNGKCGAVFKDTNRTKEQKSQDRGELFGIRQSRGLASAELMKLYVPFYCERRDGKPWEEIEEKMEARSKSSSAGPIKRQEIAKSTEPDKQ
ncbi:hypothetical protein [Profundibacter sp.]